LAADLSEREREREKQRLLQAARQGKVDTTAA
jgi:hypothetical protein